MSDEKQMPPDSEVWRQAYNAALTGVIVGDFDATAEQFAEVCCRHSDLALLSFLERWPR